MGHENKKEPQLSAKNIGIQITFQQYNDVTKSQTVSFYLFCLVLCDRKIG